MTNVTNITPLGLSLTLLAGLLVVGLPLRYAAIPFVVGSIYITLGQRIVVGGLDFTMFRILILFGWTRILIRGEILSYRINSIDITLFAWMLTSFTAYNLLWKSNAALIYQLGFLYNTLGIYIFFRVVLADLVNIEILTRVILIAIIPMALFMIVEMYTGKNLLYIFGGVPESSLVRYGEVRSQGSFQHPILTGTFAASLMPLFLMQWWKDKNGKIIAVVGFIVTTIIVITAHSSGPAFASGIAIAGFALWYYRRYIRYVRWGILFSIIALSIVMKAPVYYIFSKLSSITGGTGWHRSWLIHQFITYFDEWWLMGTTYTAHWMPYTLITNPDSADITNHYIKQGVNGGLLTLILFVLIIYLCYRNIGLKMKSLYDENIDSDLSPGGESVSLEEESDVDIQEKERILWALGAVLTVHAVSFLSVSYFDQIIVFWYLIVAAISCHTVISKFQ